MQIKSFISSLFYSHFSHLCVPYTQLRPTIAVMEENTTTNMTTTAIFHQRQGPSPANCWDGQAHHRRHNTTHNTVQHLLTSYLRKTQHSNMYYYTFKYIIIYILHTHTHVTLSLSFSKWIDPSC